MTTIEENPAPSPADPSTGASRGRGGAIGRWGVLATLFLATTAAYADRYLFGIAAEAIRLDLGLDDFELGLLAGPALAIFYAGLGVPIARWADVGHRGRILASSILVWSGFTALCAAAGGFWSMFAARIGVGVGEAGAFPPAHSYVATAARPERRGAGAALLTLATFAGAVLGAGVGGVLVAVWGWRPAFVLFGAAGLVTAPLVLYVIREPRGRPRRPSVRELVGPTLWTDAAALLARPAFRHLLAGYTLYYVFAHTLSAFGVVFLIRSFGLTEAQVGAPWSLTIASGSIAGSILAMLLVDRLAKRSRAWLGLLPALLSSLAAAAMLAGFLAASPGQVYGFFWLGMAAASWGAPALFAGVYVVTAEHERALAVALMMLAANAVGLGGGPMLAGLLSEALAPAFGSESLRVALAFFPGALVWAAAHFLLAGRALARPSAAA